MRGGDILGFTFAELILALLFTVLAIVLPSSARTTARLEAELRNNALLNAQLKEANAQLAKAREQDVTPVKAKLRSVAQPSCVEKHVSSTWLFTAVIHGENSYKIAGIMLTYSNILQRFKHEIYAADEAGCVQTIQVAFGPGITAEAYDSGLRRIEQKFYTKKIGLER